MLGSVDGTVSNVLYNGSATVPADAGSYIVTADFTPVDTVNYQTLVGATAGTLVIQQAATTTAVICGAGPFTYSGIAFTPCTANVTGPIELNQVLTVVYANNVNAGTASASASYAGSANYLASSNGTTLHDRQGDPDAVGDQLAGRPMTARPRRPTWGARCRGR